MKILLYEYVTGGGWWSADAHHAPAGSLLAEGRAMIRALAEDFSGLPGVEVRTSRDSRLPDLHPTNCRVEVVPNEAAEWNWLARQSAAADWTLLIAPETGGVLARRCRLVEDVGGRLLSPASAVVELASDKQATAQRLSLCGVPVPRGLLLHNLNQIGSWPYPAVVKPVDGCGSHGVRLLRDAGDWNEVNAGLPLRLEEFVPGLTASVAVLCGPGGCRALPPCEQRLAADGSFAYLGGRLPLATNLAARAQQLAIAAIGVLPQPRGYLGVDLVLGEAADGSGDRAIEINPRLTTSYVGLRKLANCNLAAALLAIASGNAPDLRFADQSIEFLADGTIVA